MTHTLQNKSAMNCHQIIREHEVAWDGDSVKYQIDDHNQIIITSDLNNTGFEFCPHFKDANIVAVYGSVHLQGTEYVELPAKFTRVQGNMFVNGNFIKNLDNGPNYVEGIFDISANCLREIDNCPTVASQMNFSRNNISSLRDVHKKILRCRHIDISHNPIQEGGIGLLLIPDLESITAKYYEPGNTGTGVPKPAFEIINKYIQLEVGKEGLLECQEELIEAGFERFALL